MKSIIIALLLLIGAIICHAVLTIALDESVAKEYEYCYNCQHGFCTEIPKSRTCLKWQEEVHEQRRMDSNLHDDIRS